LRPAARAGAAAAAHQKNVSVNRIASTPS
jgi:hypothetical protein